MKTEHSVSMSRNRLLWQFMHGNRLLYAGAVVAIGIATLVSLIGPLVL